MKTTPMFVTVLLISLAISFVLLAPKSYAQSETCDSFSFAVSGSRLNEIPLTVLRSGVSPILSIADKTYIYDASTHCLSESVVTSVSSRQGCEKALKIISGGKLIGLIEGQGHIVISLVDRRGRRDLSQPTYQMTVERDPTNATRPRLVIEARSADGRTIGRLDGIEGLTAKDLTNFKGRLASAHSLIDLRSKTIVYANCRKLAIRRFEDSPERGLASGSLGSASSASSAVPSKQR